MLNFIIDMYTARPGMTLVLAGTTVILASEVIYYFYKRSSASAREDKRERVKKAKSSKETKSEEVTDTADPASSASTKCLSMVIERKKTKNKKGNRSKEKEVKKLSAEDLETMKQLDGRKPPNLWNTVLFFPDYTPTLPKSSTQKLISYFENAKMSIHLCMYVCSHPQLGIIIQKKYKEGLLVQVVTDYDTFTAHNNCGAKAWKKAGIEVRMKCTGYLMHHKFAIIDEEAVLTGSLNWTKQGLLSNQENVLVSTNKKIVDLYMEEFQQLWTNYENQDAGHIM